MLYSFIKFVFNYVQYLFQKKYDKTRYTQRSPISLFPRYIIPFLYIFISFWLSCHCFFFLIICKSLNPHHLSLRVVIYINLSLAYFHLLYTRGQSRAVYRNSSFFFFFYNCITTLVLYWWTLDSFSLLLLQVVLQIIFLVHKLFYTFAIILLG